MVTWWHGGMVACTSIWSREKSWWCLTSPSILTEKYNPLLVKYQAISRWNIPMTARVVLSRYVEFAQFFHVEFGPRPTNQKKSLVIWSTYHWIDSDRIGIFNNLTHRLGISNIFGNHTWTFHRFKLTSYIHVYDWNTHRFQSMTMVFRYWVARSMINGSFEHSFFPDFHWISKDSSTFRVFFFAIWLVLDIFRYL